MRLRYLGCHAILLIILLSTHFQGVFGINCFKCSSTNGSDPACEDPINTSLTQLTEKCSVPKEGHIGLFPANFCIKIVGKNIMTYETLVIRACTMKTMDSQCGEFNFQGVEMTGCILTCDYNGCNTAAYLSENTNLIFTLLMVPFFLLMTFSPFRVLCS